MSTAGAEVLGECKALTCLDLCGSLPAGIGRLVAGLAVYKTLAHLDLSLNRIFADWGWEAGGSARGIQNAHLDLGTTENGTEGAERLEAVLGQCKALTSAFCKARGDSNLRLLPFLES
eukprot:686344-Rhodomonas_salina.3